MRAGYRAVRGKFLSQASCVALAFGALMAGAQPAFAQGMQIDSSKSARSLNGSVGQRFTLACPALREARNSIYGTDTYTADSPICQAALHAGALRAGEAGTVVIEIRPGAGAYTGSARNGVTTRSYGPHPASYRFIGTELAAAPAAGIGAPSGPPAGQPASAPAGIAKPPPSAAPASSNPLDPTGGKALAKKMLARLPHAVRMWQMQAQFTGQIHGIELVSTPGGLSGPTLEQHIRFGPVSHSQQDVDPKTADRFAKVFSDAWKQWQDTFVVPGLAAYPAFGAWPGPKAPPTANIPFPVTAGVSPHSINRGALQQALKIQFPGATPQEEEAIKTFSEAAEKGFHLWRGSTLFRNVMGSGPVPTFAPPAVRVGQVMGGKAWMAPGSLQGPDFPIVGIP